MSPRFTFSGSPVKPKPSNKRMDMQTLYSFLKGKKILETTLFKPEFVVKQYISKLSKRTKMVIAGMQRDGFKCACCEESTVRFRLKKVGNAYSFEPLVKKSNGKLVRLTMDHNLLDSLGGRYDLKNTTVLCMDCNALRGNHFAEYKEFKEWYDTTNDRSSIESSNFSYIDFKKNILDSKKAKHMVDVAVIPESVRTALTERFASGIIDLEYEMAYGTTNFSNETINNFLNEMVQVYVKNHVGVKYARKPNYDFTDFPRDVLSTYRRNQIQMIEQCAKDEVTINTSLKQYAKNILRTFIMRK